MSPTIPPHERCSKVERCMNAISDDGTAIWVALHCHFPAQPVITTRLCHVYFEDNPDLPDAPESLIFRYDPYSDDDEVQMHRNALYSFINDQLAPQLMALSSASLLFAPRDPSFVASTVKDTDGLTTQLCPGLPDSMREAETMCLRRLRDRGGLGPTTPSDVPIYDIDVIRVLEMFVSGSRAITRVLLPDGTIGVLLQIPNVYTLLSEPMDSGVAAMEVGTLHEVRLLRTLPPHPHISGPPIAYISREFEGAPLICGFVLRFLPGGNVRDAVDNGQVALARRVKWARQLAGALLHVHKTAHTYHGDVKLDNAILDEKDDLVLIDFEQGRANEEAAAPEMHAGCEVTVGSDGKLLYRRPAEPVGDEEGLPRLANRMYPYDAWLKVPRAIEAAEVHVLGVALTRLFREGEGSEEASAIVKRCKAEDPNERPTLEDVETFFEKWFVALTA